MNSMWKLAMLLSVAACIAAWSGIAAAESEEAGRELQNYFSNANTTGGQGTVYVVNPIEGGERCAMIYVFDTAQDLQVCCGCPISAEALLTLSISGNLAPNPVGSLSILMDGSIRILATMTNATPPPPGDSLSPGENCDPFTSSCCDPTAAVTAAVPMGGVPELVAWATHIQNTQITESEFLVELPSGGFVDGGVVPGNGSFGLPIEGSGDPVELPQACSAITQLGSGAGVCTCPTGPI
jgi:hypothetical protein